MEENLKKRLETACAVTWEAGRAALKYFQTSVEVELKEDQSPVTVADHEVEQILHQGLLAAFPQDGFLGEERGEQVGTSGFRWVVDPIDGTKSFVRGVPLFGSLVALEDPSGEIVLGVANLPALDELTGAARGEGCFLNGRRVRVSGVESVAEATVSFTSVDSFKRTGNAPALEAIWKHAGLLRGWGDCYGHLLVASGKIDAMLDPVLADWDCAALLPILEEAGGTFTDWSGTRTYKGKSGVSTNGKIAAELQALLGPAK